MAVKNIQGSAGKRRVHRKSIVEGERSALLDRRNASFAAKRRSPHPSTLHVYRAATSSETPPTGAASPASSPSSSTPSYTVGTNGNPLTFTPLPVTTHTKPLLTGSTMLQLTWKPSLAASWTRVDFPVTSWMMSTTYLAVKVLPGVLRCPSLYIIDL